MSPKDARPGNAGATAASCPICGSPAQPESRPFCSTRCADIDLGRWLSERYVIPEAGDDRGQEYRDYDGAPDDTPHKP